MRVAVVHNQDTSGVINVFGMQNREKYNPRTVEAVASALEAGGHTVHVIDGNMHVIDQLTEFMPKVMAGERPGMVFNMAYGIQGVSRYTHLPAMLEMLGVPYVGSGPQAHGLALDKVVAKMVFESEGVPTPGFWNFAKPDAHFADLEFPVIVKPKMEAVSYGIKVVYGWDELHEAVDAIMSEFGQHVLVEQFIPGREFAVGLLGNAPPEVLPIVEIDLGGDADAIQSSDDKLHTPKEKLVPAPLDEERASELRALALRSFDSLGLYDFARIDVRMDKDGHFYVLEINSMASLGRTGSYVAAAGAAGYTYDTLINRMLDVAAIRYFGGEYLTEQAERGARRRTPEKLSTVVRRHVRGGQAATEKALRQMVDMRSSVDNPEAVNAFGDWLAGQMKQVGFAAEVFDRVDVGNTVLFHNHGAEEFDVLLLGHLDTAPGRFRRFSAEGGRLLGSGIAEHKGGLAVMLSALRALRFARRLRKLKVGILLTGDETLGGRRNRDLVMELSARAGRVLGLKAGETNGAVVTSRAGRGTYRVELEYEDTAVPSPEAAARVFREVCRRVDSLHRLTDSESGLYVAVTDLRVAGPFGSIPEEAGLAATLRFSNDEQGREADAEFRRVFKKGPAKGRFRISGGVRRPARVAGEATQVLAQSVIAIAEEANMNVSTAHRLYSSDICYVPPEIPAIDGFGPVGWDVRGSSERIARVSLSERAALLALVMADAQKG